MGAMDSGTHTTPWPECSFVEGWCSPSLFQWPADLADPQVRAKLVEFLKICDEGGFRPFQHHAGLAPDRYRRLMGTAS